MFDCPPALSTEWQNVQLDISKKWTPGRRDNWAIYDLIDSISENLVWMLKTPRLFALFAFHNGWIIYGRRSYSLCSRDFVRESIHHYDICRSPHVILINGENFILPRDKLDRFIAVFSSDLLFISLHLWVYESLQLNWHIQHSNFSDFHYYC